MVFSVLARFRLAFQDFDIHFPPEFCLGHLPFTRIRVLINTHTFQPVIYRNFPRHSLCFIPEQLRNIRDNFNIIQKIPKHSRKKSFSQKHQVQPLRVSLCISRWKKTQDITSCSKLLPGIRPKLHQQIDHLPISCLNWGRPYLNRNHMKKLHTILVIH
jgi:hypothetical protein